jgi:mono/diheme cytochrome c family protein
MRRLKRVAVVVLGLLVGVVAVLASVVYFGSEARLRKRYEVAVAPLAIPTDAATIERGWHLVNNVNGCASCHADNLGGQVFLDIPPALLVATNITSGAGGIGGTYTDADWIKAIRHGVRPDGTPILFMPSQNLRHITDADLAAIIAYIKTVPAVDNQLAASELRPLGRALLVAGQLPFISAEQIDYQTPLPAAQPPGRTVEYGGHLTRVALCVDCHTNNLSGAPFEEGAPPAANLTPGGELAGWLEEDFIKVIRTGIAPGGRQINEAMPWQEYGGMTDDELGAIYRYLQSLPALPYNTPVEQ